MDITSAGKEYLTNKSINISITTFTPLCDAKSFGGGSFGQVYICDHDIVEKRIFYPAKGDENIYYSEINTTKVLIELEFMKKLCSETKVNNEFIKLYYHKIDEENQSFKKLTLGIPKYTMDLSSINYDFLKTNILSIHNRVIKCIDKLNKLKYVHRDIKGGNILINETNIDSIVLSDFGSVISHDDLISKPFYDYNGTSLLYTLPFSSIPKNLSIIDKWSWLLTLYTLITKKYYYLDLLNISTENYRQTAPLTFLYQLNLYFIKNTKEDAKKLFNTNISSISKKLDIFIGTTLTDIFNEIKPSTPSSGGKKKKKYYLTF